MSGPDDADEVTAVDSGPPSGAAQDAASGGNTGASATTATQDAPAPEPADDVVVFEPVDVDANDPASARGGVVALHPAPSTSSTLVSPAIAATEKNTLRVGLVPFACWRAHDMRFDFGSSFVLPDIQSELGELNDLLVAHTKDGKKPSLSVFGHADPTGSDDYNKKLSGRRAQAIYGLLTRNVDLWEDLYAHPLGDDQWQPKAIRRMQDTLGKTRNDHPSASDRKALYKAYMDSVSTLRDDQGQPKKDDAGDPQTLTLDPADFLAGGADDKGKGDYQGCGEFNPIVVFSQDQANAFAAPTKKKERDQENVPNRRVLVFLFRPGIKVLATSWPCPRVSEGVDGCKKRFWSDGETRRSNQDEERRYEDTKDTFACRFYDRLSNNSPCEVKPPPPPPPPPPPAPAYGPRPFYVVGHNPNTFDLIKKALDGGANAVEPDINVYKHRQNNLCVSHGEGADDAPALVDFLKYLHDMAGKYPAFSHVVFDCKPKVAASAAHGVELLTAIRTHLTHDTKLNIIMSVAALADAGTFFDGVKGMVGEREGLMVDEENNANDVSRFFTGIHVTHQGYGNGISVANSVLGPNVRPAEEFACELRAQNNLPKFIYVWTVNAEYLEREYIRIGVDGIITDDVPRLVQILKEPEFTSLVRMATREDDPYNPPNAAYGLCVRTGDVGHAGTDAKVTFTLTGANGSTSMTVDTSLHARMERASWTYVTLQSKDLGALTSLTVQRDDSGNAPDWFLERVLVRSARYGQVKEAVYSRWIDSTSPVTVPITTPT